MKRRAGLSKLHLERLTPLLRFDNEVALLNRVKILRIIAQPAAFNGKELAVRGPKVRGPG